LANKARSARIVAAFSTIPSEVLFSVFDARRKSNRPSLVYCGDDHDAKELVATLIRDVGFHLLDAGPLRMARYTEPFSLLVAQLAYETGAGPQLAYRFERFAE
jgi:predicted dinucleotide-binding enzyme